jgi:autotransporter-associated beta strand protein
MKTMRQMMVAVVATAISLVSSAVFAAPLELAGVGQTVTDVSELAAYDGVTNSSGGNPALLTFNVATDMAYAGTISGNIKVVKMGNGMLDLSGSNTYTGGTQVDDGRLVASSLTAFGATTGAIQVNSDCNGYAQGNGVVQSNNVTCVAFNCAGEFAYPINTSAWTTPSAGPNGYGGIVYYNVAVMVRGVTLSGKITGGGLSVHFGGLSWKDNADSPSGSSGELTISGDIDCGDTDTVYLE